MDTTIEGTRYVNSLSDAGVLAYLQTKVFDSGQSWHAFAVESKNLSAADLIRSHARDVAHATLNAFLCHQKLYSRSLYHNLIRSKAISPLGITRTIDYRPNELTAM